MKTTTKQPQAALLFITLLFLSALPKLHAQVPHPELGLRAQWMRGAYGLNWKPTNSANANSESLSQYDSISYKFPID